MSICRAVVHLSEQLKPHIADDEELSNLLRIVERMPAFADARRLDQWEHLATMFPMVGMTGARGSIWEIIEFGRCSLYGKIQPKRTRGFYDTACAFLGARHGIVTKPASEFDLSKWR